MVQIYAPELLAAMRGLFLRGGRGWEGIGTERDWEVTRILATTEYLNIE